MNAPNKVVIDKESRLVRLDWSSGMSTKLSHYLLRIRCACADCKATMLRGEELLVDPEIFITAALPVGSYAIQFNFSDGHERGIYPWEYLHALATTSNL